MYTLLFHVFSVDGSPQALTSFCSNLSQAITYFRLPRFAWRRRLAQVHKSGDPLRIVAVDENCQLQRRTCGMPYAEVIPCPLIGKLLLRDCSRRPYGKDTLCRQRATLRDEAPRPSHVEIGRHRLRRALRTEGDVQYLEIQMEGHGNWQPAATVHEETLRRYFATLADGNIRRRRVSSLAPSCLPRDMSTRSQPRVF